jgi:hypothetical protein
MALQLAVFGKCGGCQPSADLHHHVEELAANLSLNVSSYL